VTAAAICSAVGEEPRIVLKDWHQLLLGSARAFLNAPVDSIPPYACAQAGAPTGIIGA
jgi:hypothetical protein